MKNTNSANMNTEPVWDLEIKPSGSWFDLRLKELWSYRDLIALLIRRDFVAQYKQTLLGPLWHLIQPVLTTGMFLILFSRIAAIPTDNLPPVLFYLSGIIIWNYFSTCLITTSNTFVANAAIFGKVYFPRLVIPISVVFSNLIRFCIQLLLLAAVLAFYMIKGAFQISLNWHLLLLPILVLLMAGMGLGWGIIISSLTAKYRDFSVLTSFAVQLLMYATPVVFPMSYLSGKGFAAVIAWNPLCAVVEGFRYALFQSGTFRTSDLVYPSVFCLLSMLFGALIFTKVERTFLDTV
jgi:lipopolysaccharide transport system permease protein